MTITLFVTIFTVGAMVSGLLTEAIKKAYQNAEKKYSANVIALVDAAVVGGLDSMCLHAPWNTMDSQQHHLPCAHDSCCLDRLHDWI